MKYTSFSKTKVASVWSFTRSSIKTSIEHVCRFCSIIIQPVRMQGWFYYRCEKLGRGMHPVLIALLKVLIRLTLNFFFFFFASQSSFYLVFFKEFYREKKNYTTLLARRVTEWNYTCEAKDVYIFFIQFFFCPKRVCMIVCSPISIPSCRISFFSDDS